MSTVRSGPGSIAFREVEPETHTQVTKPRLLVARTAELRDSVTGLSGDVESLHAESQEHQLSLLGVELGSLRATDLLEELAERFALPWVLVARVVGVTPAAVRKWRRGETISPAFHQRLAEFVAFCRVLQERDPRIDDVGHWMETPVVGELDVTRVDLYLDGHRIALLDLARQFITGEQILDSVEPDWRARAASRRRFDVLHHEDGSTSIVPSEEP